MSDLQKDSILGVFPEIFERDVTRATMRQRRSQACIPLIRLSEALSDPAGFTEEEQLHIVDCELCRKIIGKARHPRKRCALAARAGTVSLSATILAATFVWSKVIPLASLSRATMVLMTLMTFPLVNQQTHLPEENPQPTLAASGQHRPTGNVKRPHRSASKHVIGTQNTAVRAALKEQRKLNDRIEPQISSERIVAENGTSYEEQPSWSTNERTSEIDQPTVALTTPIPSSGQACRYENAMGKHKGKFQKFVARIIEPEKRAVSSVIGSFKDSPSLEPRVQAWRAK